MQKNLKILIGPHDIAGYYANLAKGLNKIGLQSDYITYLDHPFKYGNETHNPFILRIAKNINTFSKKSKFPLLIKKVFSIFEETMTIIWALIAIFKYDVFIFGFGKSLLRFNIDLYLLRLFNKKVISNLAHGSEARPMYVDGSFQNMDGSIQPSLNQIIAGAKNSRKVVERHQKLSTFLIGAPFSTSYFATKKFINAFAIGIPFEYNLVNSKNFENKNHKICRILHSPSHPAAKGSPLIIEAINSLKKRGFLIDLVIIQGKSNSEVINEIQSCDFIIDQVYSDTPLAGFATEAAWFGKPAIVGGYGFINLKKILPIGMWPPSKICKPDELEQAIESMIVNKEDRLLLGQEASEFVRSKWSVTNVAFRYKQIIDGNIPEDWWLNPYDVIYLEGAGQSSDIIKKNIKDIVSKSGVKSLQLSHRPDLEIAFLEFAGININVNA